MISRSGVVLRPVAPEDLAVFELALASPPEAGAFQWFGFTPGSGLRRAFAENGLLTQEGGTLAVVADGALAGRVEWFKALWGRETSFCWTIAAGLRPEWRGRGIGTQAQRQLVDYLFRASRVERIQAYTDIENVAERRVLEKIGFALEGILRSSQWRDGAWHDLALYSILRSR